MTLEKKTQNLDGYSYPIATNTTNHELIWFLFGLFFGSFFILSTVVSYVLFCPHYRENFTNKFEIRLDEDDLIPKIRKNSIPNHIPPLLDLPSLLLPNLDIPNLNVIPGEEAPILDIPPILEENPILEIPPLETPQLDISPIAPPPPLIPNSFIF